MIFGYNFRTSQARGRGIDEGGQVAVQKLGINTGRRSFRTELLSGITERRDRPRNALFLEHNVQTRYVNHSSIQHGNLKFTDGRLVNPMLFIHHIVRDSSEDVAR